MRIFEQKRLWQMNEALYQHAIDLFAKNLNRQEYTTVLGIARGGSKPAADLAHKMNLPFVEVRARYNSSNDIYSKPMEKVLIEETTIPELKPGKYLLVDDIYGTGATIEAVSAALREKQPAADFVSLTLVKNMGSETFPDYCLWTVKDWILFPWENYSEEQKSLPVELLPRLEKLSGTQAKT